MGPTKVCSTQDGAWPPFAWKGSELQILGLLEADGDLGLSMNGLSQLLCVTEVLNILAVLRRANQGFMLTV